VSILPKRIFAAALTLATLAAQGAASAATGVSLRSVAARDGYTMRWLGPERSVRLSRNGIVVVIRPGAVLYDVNSRQEVADVAPVATGRGDVVISASFAQRLGVLARESASTDPAPVGRAVGPVVPAVREPIVVSARQITGRHALFVQGSAPQNARVTLTLLATLAPDLPTVLLERSDVQADLTGRFAAVVSLAPDYLAGSFVTLVATSDDAQSASTHLVLDGAP
jgi:Copper amine oxidase N-terminal domain